MCRIDIKKGLLQNLDFRWHQPLFAFPDSIFPYEAACGDSNTTKTQQNTQKSPLTIVAESFCLVCYFACYAIFIFVLEKTGNGLLQNIAVLQQPYVHS
ncbi:MAG: hypothetical protein MJ202_07910 [Lentisphaeria bacterium]|nr:hypothetical protein [Lentisphaeria bacterium]